MVQYKKYINGSMWKNMKHICTENNKNGVKNLKMAFCCEECEPSFLELKVDFTVLDTEGLRTRSLFLLGRLVDGESTIII